MIVWKIEMKKLDISAVVNNNLCFSCGACDVSCHVNAIRFSKTNIGRLHPVIDYDICTNCGVCYKICPGLDIKNRVFKSFDDYNPFAGRVITTYVGKSTNTQVYDNSQSGGLATETLSYLFDKKLISHALVVKMDYSASPVPNYFFASSLDELFSSQKSLYTPINILSALNEIKNINGNIAVVGLPCHIEGIVSLISFKPELFSKIKYKLGLICDGVFAYCANDYFLNDSPKKHHKIVYKNKHHPNYIHAKVTLEYKDKTYIAIDPQERFFLKEHITPPRCLLCFDKLNILADIVYGDPWGVNGYDTIRGESVVITRNNDAQTLIEEIVSKKRAVLREVEFQTILDGQKIEERKKKVKSASKAYVLMGFDTPGYFEQIKPFINDFKADGGIQKKIKKFLRIESRKKDEILEYLINERKKVIFKTKVKAIIKKILLVRYWKKI